MIPEMEGLLFWEGNIFRWKGTSQRNQQGSINMVCTAGGKRHKISQLLETHQEALSEKTECSKGLPS